MQCILVTLYYFRNLYRTSLHIQNMAEPNHVIGISIIALLAVVPLLMLLLLPGFYGLIGGGLAAVIIIFVGFWAKKRF